MGLGSKNLVLDDALIKERICGWKKEPDERKFRIILEMLSPMIYEYPVRVFNRDEDTSGFFFEYVQGKLGPLLEKYDAQEARFSTWLFVVLRNLYFNWIRSLKKKEVLKTVPMKTPSQDTDLEIDWGDVRQYETWNQKENESEPEDSDSPSRVVGRIINSLHPQHQLLLSVLYGEIDLEALFKNRTAKNKKSSLKDVMERYAQAKAEIQRKNKLSLEKLRFYNKEIQNLQVKEHELQSRSREIPEDKIALEEIRKEIKLKKGYRVKIEDCLRRANLNIPYGIAAEILGWSEGKVKKIAHIIRNRIKSEFLKKEKS